MHEATNYEKYAVLEAEKLAIQAEQDGLRKEIISEMEERGEKNAKTAVGTFTVAQLKTWTYTPGLSAFEKTMKSQIEELSEEIKAAKAIEEETGDATFVEKPSLRFVSVKL